jgi:hypothetical protein
MSEKKTGKKMSKAKLEAFQEMFAAAAIGETFDLVVRRGGNASSREVFVNGTLRLDWNGQVSVPVPLPAGTYKLHCVVMGKAGETFAFTMEEPHHDNLGSGALTDLGAQVFDPDVDVP